MGYQQNSLFTNHQRTTEGIYCPENGKDRGDPEMILEITSIGHSMKYTLPFTPENPDSLYARRKWQKTQGMNSSITLPYVSLLS